MSQDIQLTEISSLFETVKQNTAKIVLELREAKTNDLKNNQQILPRQL